MLLSGINRREKIGQVALRSGTVGAALTARANGIRAVALSHAVPRDGGEPGWTHAAGIARELLPLLMEHPTSTVLNVNVPVTTGDHVDLRPAVLARFGVVQTTATEADEDSGDSVRLAVSEPTDTARRAATPPCWRRASRR